MMRAMRAESFAGYRGPFDPQERRAVGVNL